MGAGAVIHGRSNEQDTRRFGAIGLLLPGTFGTILMGSCSISGVPFYAAYYSKEAILEAIALSFDTHEMYAETCGLITAAFTGFYSMRILFVLSGMTMQSPLILLLAVHEASGLLVLAKDLLLWPSVLAGRLTRDLFADTSNTSFTYSTVV
jgi:NADH:ubiquinone oxidoreductase subunit 5 (subunit L)/multisubunit Na+/H+ antiporter MnhA subunit